MGADIHAYIEYTVQENGIEYVRNFSSPCISRDYYFFGLLAKVRMDPQQLDGKPISFPVRGIPEKNSYVFELNYTFLVVDKKDDEDDDDDEEHYPQTVTKEKAKEWGNEWYDKEHTKIVSPDYHTPSYLYADELEVILNRLLNLQEIFPKFNSQLTGIVNIMKQLNGDNPKRSRFVFYFDN